MNAHTKEPWVNHQEDNIITDTDGLRCLAQARGSHISIDERNANARRIVACINACAGISTKVLETLEDKTLNEMFKRQETEYQAQRDRLLAELKHSTNILYDEGIYNGQVQENLAVINDVESSK
jgi:hypothetical protein